jgi:hypothetical protein
MPKARPGGPTLSEIAVVAGVSHAQARSAVGRGVLTATDLTWGDALLLRVHFIVVSTRFPGELSHQPALGAEARARLAVTLLRDGVESSDIPVDGRLVITRQDVRLLKTLSYVFTYLEGELSGLEAAQVLPVGHWWNDICWRMKTEIREHDVTTSSS